MSMVYFCLECDDQAPWKSVAGGVQECPTCKKTTSVMAATRFQNMESGLHDEL